ALGGTVGVSVLLACQERVGQHPSEGAVGTDDTTPAVYGTTGARASGEALIQRCASAPGEACADCDLDVAITCEGDGLAEHGLRVGVTDEGGWLATSSERHAYVLDVSRDGVAERAGVPDELAGLEIL